MCEHCEDTGWIRVAERGTTVARRCDCHADRAQESRYAKLGLPPRLAGLSFATMEFPSYRLDSPSYNKAHDVVRRARRFADQFPAGKSRGLLLHGDDVHRASEIGVATLKLIADKGLDCLYFDYQGLMQALAARSHAGSRSAEIGHRIARSILRTDVLMIDAVGERRVTDWGIDTTAALIKYCYLNNRGLILTTTLPLQSRAEQALPGTQRMLAAAGSEDSLAARLGWQTYERIRSICDLVSVRMSSAPTKAPARA